MLAVHEAPAVDSLLARRHYLAARDQEALLRYDSALALYRAARRADPTYLPAQLSYIELMIQHLQAAELQREYRLRPGERSATAQCLALATGWLATSTDPVAWARRFERLEPGSPCAAVVLGGYLGFPSPIRLRYGLRAALAMPERATTWVAYAEALNDAVRWRDAHAHLEEGSRRVAHPLDRVSLMSRLAIWRLARGDTAGAAAMRATARDAAIRDGRPGLALLLVNVGETEQDRRGWDERLRIARAAGSWYEQWHTLRMIGNLLIDRGEPARAIPIADQAVAIVDSVGLPGLAVITYTQRGRAFVKAGRMDDAARDLAYAARIGTRVRPLVYAAEAWHNLAHAYEGQGRLAQASVAADRFMALAESTDGSTRLTSLLDAGLIRWKQGRHAASRAAYEEMLRWVDAHRVERYWAGEYLERIGEFGRALSYYRAGATLEPQSVVNLRGQVRVFAALGYLDSAETAARAHDAGDWNTPNEIPLVPRVLARTGRLTEALRIARAWAVRQQAGGNVQGETLARLELAQLLLGGHQPGPAAIEALRAESLAQRLHLTAELIDAMRLKGVALITTGARDAGLAVLERAADLARAHPTAASIVATHTALGDALAATNPDAALASYEAAAAAVEDLTGRLDADLDRAGYREQHLAPFDGALRALLRSRQAAGRIGVLLRWSHRRKSAALALALRVPRAEQPTRGLSVGDIQRRLGGDEALVDYIVLEGAVAAVVLTRRAATLVRLPASRDSLSAMVDRLRRPLSATYGRRLDLARAPFDLDLAHTVYQAVLAPLAPALTGMARLLIVADGPLHYLAFEALVVSPPFGAATDYASAHYAIDDVAIEYLPSAEFVSPASDRLASLASTGRVLAVMRGVDGGPRELDAIRGAWGATRVITLEGDATGETAVHDAVPHFPILHFAVHATADARDPLASHLALAPDSRADGQLRMHEIAARRSRARLVVLSACETQSGRNYGGEGVLSLARGFLLGGAQAVIATRWPVGPTAADLMGELHRGLASGVPAGAALRSSRLMLRRDPRTAHPFYWAAFALIRR